MRVIKKIGITDEVLVSSTIDEDDYSEWSAVTTYALNDRVIKASTHKIYSSVIADNLNNDPEDDIQGDRDNPPAHWVEVSPTNRWMLFDGQRLNLTHGTSPMTYVITTPSGVDSLVIINADCSFVDITVEFEEEEIYNKTIQMTGRTVSDWYEYFFKPFDIIKTTAVFDIPPIIGATVTVTFRKEVAEPVSCGILAFGVGVIIGQAEFGAESDLRTFSRNEPNEFGVSELVKRAPKGLTRQKVIADKSLTPMLRQLREDLESVPAIWSTIDDVGDDFFDAFIINGIADRFLISADNPTKTTLQLELREI